MAANLEDILNNVKQVYLTDSSLVTLLDYERVIDELDLYSYRNWKLGELVEGPIYEKYFVTCKWMYPYRRMPDPAGAERLLNYGCEITYQEDEFKYPIDVKTPDDFKPGTKVPRIVSKPIWVVTITMPKKLMGDIQRGSIELENESLDAEDIESAYEQGMDDETADQAQDQENEQQQLATPTI
jgi:hypothetical protein